MLIPPHIKHFTDLFKELPSLGPRQATRLAFHIKSLGAASIKELATALQGLIDVRTCKQCFFTYEEENEKTTQGLCHICSNPGRNQKIIAVVEKETDLISIEKSKKFNGIYLVLGELKKDGALSNEQRLRLESMKKRFKDESASEIIIATNPTPYGDLNAITIDRELKPIAQKLTRLGRGMPTGGEIEFADEETLGGALENRR